MTTTEDLHRAGEWIAKTFELLWIKNKHGPGYALRKQHLNGKTEGMKWQDVLDILMFGAVFDTCDIAMTYDLGEPTYRVTVAGETVQPCVSYSTSLVVAMSNVIVAGVCRHLDSEGPNAKEELKP